MLSPLVDLVLGPMQPQRGGGDRRRSGGLIDAANDLITRLIAAAWQVCKWLLLLQAVLMMACSLYALLYWARMPARISDTPLYFDYGLRGMGRRKAPTADVDFLTKHTQWHATNLTQTSAEASGVLRPGQHYAVGVELEMAQSLTNVKVGVFMVNVKLMDKEDNLLASSGRAAFLPHASNLFHFVRLAALWPLFLVGVLLESDTVRVYCFDHFEESAANPVAKASVVLSSPDVQLYAARLFVSPELTGVTQYMHRWFWTSAVVGVALLSSVLLTLAAFAYAFYCVLQEENSSRAQPGRSNATGLSRGNGVPSASDGSNNNASISRSYGSGTGGLLNSQNARASLSTGGNENLAREERRSLAPSSRMQAAAAAYGGRSSEKWAVVPSSDAQAEWEASGGSSTENDGLGSSLDTNSSVMSGAIARRNSSALDGGVVLATTRTAAQEESKDEPLALATGARDASTSSGRDGSDNSRSGLAERPVPVAWSVGEPRLQSGANYSSGADGTLRLRRGPDVSRDHSR